MRRLLYYDCKKKKIFKNKKITIVSLEKHLRMNYIKDLGHKTDGKNIA
ncbi:MAG: hypothetical protein KKD05_09660 [Candidatus Omnitrophica bacterium]|nr:hypothetical protein [Candidatus Omnitrophota bacterium]